MKKDILNEIYKNHRLNKEGNLSTYIPALSNLADPLHFGISALTVNGEYMEFGDTNVKFSLQSISKVFLLLMAFEEFGLKKVYEKVSVEPLGDIHNTIKLDYNDKPHNPMINSGAIAIAGMLYKKYGKDTKDKIIEAFSQYANRFQNLDLNEIVYKEHCNTGYLNKSISYLLRYANIIDDPVESILDIYDFACAINVTARDLSTMCALLANRGTNPINNKNLVDSYHVQHVLSIMLTCGLYTNIGRWAVDIGVPAKSGISGGLIASVNQRFGLGIYSPLIDEHGTSIKALHVCNDLDDKLNIHVIEHI